MIVFDTLCAQVINLYKTLKMLHLIANSVLLYL